VPVTVLSRCQRFDLRRVKFDVLVNHFAGIAESEGAKIARGAIGLIARAADGSVRDGLSMLDQAIAHSGPETEITEDIVRNMLGVAERVQVFDLFEQLMKGDIAEALESFDFMYHAGADPVLILQDLAELTHWLTRLKAAPEASEATPTSDLDLERGRDISSRLPMSALARVWQILLKGLGELRSAPSSVQAAEMVLVRIAYAAELPSPADVIAGLDKPSPVQSTAAMSGSERQSETASEPESLAKTAPVSAAQPVVTPPKETSQTPAPPAAQTGGAALALQAEVVTFGEEGTGIPLNFEDMVALFAANGEPLIHAYLVNNVHLVKYEVGKISLRVSEDGPRDIAQSLSRCLNDWTSRAWFVETSDEEGAPTLQQQRDDVTEARRKMAIAHPLVQETLAAFPGSEVTEVRSVADRESEDAEGLEMPHFPDPDGLGFDPDYFDSRDFDPDNTDEDDL
jgi:DNA polymerase-3 subunit gamma/tau